MGIAKLRITQTLATIKPTSAHRPILRCMYRTSQLAMILRLDESEAISLVGSIVVVDHENIRHDTIAD